MRSTLQILVEEIDSGEVVLNSTWTFKAYADHFIEIRKLSGEVTEGAIRREAEKLSSLGFVIGEMKLQDITPDVIECALIDLRSGKSKSGRRLSASHSVTLRNARNSIGVSYFVSSLFPTTSALPAQG